VTHDAARQGRWFGWALAGVAAAALAVRVAYVLVDRRDIALAGDSYFYHSAANLLADGKGFISPFFLPAHRPAAEHPPLYTMFVAVASVAGLRSVLAHMLWSCLLGTGTVVLVGLVGRRVAGDRAGVIAAVLAALYPNMWAPDGALQAETLGMFLTVLAMLLAYRYWERPSLRRLVVLGAVCGAGALTRSELLLLVPLVVVPLALRTSERPRRDRLLWLGASALAAVLVIAPWTIYNATRFKHPVLLSAQIGPLLASANCDATYYGAFQGYFDIQCQRAVNDREGLTDADDQSEIDVVDRRAALEYIRKHLDRLPTVERARLLRIAGLYHPTFYVYVDSLIDQRELNVSWAALYSFYALALLSIPGVILLWPRREHTPLSPVVAPIVVVVITVMVTYANTRFRTTTEPSLAILTAVTIDAAIRAVHRAPRPGSAVTMKREN
jgi:4-amino-4-deoxy-L-arabinose transferase-like glycosyltransferase